MTDREKVIKAIECCLEHQKTGFAKIGCSHNGCVFIEEDNCVLELLADILVLLKAQEPEKEKIPEYPCKNCCSPSERAACCGCEKERQCRLNTGNRKGNEVGMIEKVINGVECAIQYGPHYCGGEFGDENEYSRIGQNVLMDALVLLKAQEPRVMTLEEVKSCWRNREIAFLVEYNDGGSMVWMLYYGYLSTLEVIVFVDEIAHLHNFGVEGYGIDWRCWTSRPDKKRRAETPWE